MPRLPAISAGRCPALQYRRRVCDRWAAEPDAFALTSSARQPGARLQLSATWAAVEPPRESACARRASRAAIGSAFCCRRRRDGGRPHRGLQVGAIAIPLFALFGPEALQFRLGDSGAVAVVTNRDGAAKLAAIRGAAGSQARPLHRRCAAGCPISRPRWRKPAAFARRYRADDPAPHHLHLRHHRPAEGRAACASRAARPPAGRGDEPRSPAAAGRPHLDAGRLGLDRRPARRAAAGAAPRRPRRRAALREVHRRGGLPADPGFRRPQRLPAADRAEDDALLADAETRGASTCARSPAAARRSAPSCSTGAGGCSASPSTSSTARPNATCRLLLRDPHGAAPRRDGPAGARP